MTNKCITFNFKSNKIIRTTHTPNEIVIYDYYAEIIIYNKHCEEIARTKIDLEFINRCSKIKWSLHNAGYASNRKLKMTLHQFIIKGDINYKLTRYEIDHINGDKLDNRINNLRLITKSENRFNRISKGYYFHKGNKRFMVTIKINKVSIHIGSYINEDDAIKARKSAENKYFPNIKIAL